MTSTFDEFINNNPEQKALFDKEYEEFLLSEFIIRPKCVYKPYNGKLGDYLTVYLEMHDSRHREESFQNRMKMYYSRLKELNL